MTLAVLVLAHRSPRQVALLLSALAHPGVRLYLHLDRAVDAAPFDAALAERGLTDVCRLPRFRSRWGGIEVVDATLAGLTRAAADGCGHAILISGQDLPLWPAERIVGFFADAPERSYVTSFPLPDPRWRYDGRLRTDFYTYTVLGRRETCIPRGEVHTLNWKGRTLNGLLRLRGAFAPRRGFPACARPFGGSQWWNLSREAVDHVLAFVRRHPEYRAYHEHTLAPDEMFFQSILLGTGFADDHDIVDDTLRFMVWPGGSSHPRTLGAQDVPAMLASGKPFARKFDLGDDPDAPGALWTALGAPGTTPSPDPRAGA
jgi:Core-2/I-Branching enzyme